MPLPQGACHNATMLVALATGTAELATLPFAIEELRRCHCHGEAATEGIINEFGSVGAAICFYNNVCGICHTQRATGNETFLKLDNCHDATATGNWPRMGRLLNSSISATISRTLCHGGTGDGRTRGATGHGPRATCHVPRATCLVLRAASWPLPRGIGPLQRASWQEEVARSNEMLWKTGPELNFHDFLGISVDFG